MKNIAVMGSTGSIGTQTLDIIEQHPDLFRATVLTAKSNYKLLAEQAHKFRPDTIVIADEEAFRPLSSLTADLHINVECGTDALANAGCSDNVDIVIAALVGYSGLIPTINAIKAGKTIALANKETLVAGGSIVTTLAKKHGVDIIPVDSEHSAIFQCLQGEKSIEARKILLTASGGPFRNFSLDEMRSVTPQMALKHPNWNMGAKVTIDSASMMNKGFEMIEAHWLFNCPPEKIEILVHPESIVHSMVEYIDGSIKAQLGTPDMHTPIRYALGYALGLPVKSSQIPTAESESRRLPSPAAPLDFCQIASLTFQTPDYDKFPLLRYAFEAINKGGNMPCILNAANEVAVRAFLDGRIRFLEMGDVARKAMDSSCFIDSPSLSDLILTHEETSRLSSQYIDSLTNK